MSNTALNDLIAELRQLDRTAPVFNEMINAMLAILDAHQIKPATRAPKCSICNRAQFDECVSGWIPNAYTIKRDNHEYVYAVRCENFTKAVPGFNAEYEQIKADQQRKKSKG